MNDDERYFDPKTNPFLPVDDNVDPLEPGDEGFDGRVPFRNIVQDS